MHDDNDDDTRRWTGRSDGEHASLHAAFEDAWHRAKKEGAAPGEYDVAIKIETTNPIHAYIVTITPSG